MTDEMGRLPVIECLVAILNRCKYGSNQIGSEEDIESTNWVDSEGSWRSVENSELNVRDLQDD